MEFIRTIVLCVLWLAGLGFGQQGSYFRGDDGKLGYGCWKNNTTFDKIPQYLDCGDPAPILLAELPDQIPYLPDALCYMHEGTVYCVFHDHPDQIPGPALGPTADAFVHTQTVGVPDGYGQDCRAYPCERQYLPEQTDTPAIHQQWRPPVRTDYIAPIAAECDAHHDELEFCDSMGCRCLHTEPSPHEWTCADKSRVLLTAEDGTRHCLRLEKP